MPDLTIYVPCYNEEALIANTLSAIREAGNGFDFEYEVLIYNDGSTDRTEQVVADYIRENGLGDRFKLISFDGNRGIGVNYFDAAERGSGEYFIVIFGDNSEPVESIVKMFNLLGKADMIVPYFDSRVFDCRFNTDHRGIIRRLLSINFARMVRVFSGHDIRYFNGFVMHRRENVVKYKISAYGLGYQAELICRILDEEPETSYLEVRMACASRTEGMPTAFKPRNIISVAGSLSRILWRRLSYKRPNP